MQVVITYWQVWNTQLPLISGGTHSPTQYAFVRWYKHAPIHGDLLEAAGCVRVVYDTASRKGTQELYEVIHLSSIVCRHHVPSFRDKGSFYVSCFSPVRPV